MAKWRRRAPLRRARLLYVVPSSATRRVEDRPWLVQHSTAKTEMVDLLWLAAISARHHAHAPKSDGSLLGHVPAPPSSSSHSVQHEQDSSRGR
eukprot:CAMPEP_0169165686 /NCGR_PEP_ID=MMETSP1015-20121227/59552_1 /TAXON_ID=342587 /ORGANISM="Karlodinium micrum, Strain CCMP2283" /LENGTH=92 /DNA_ID=CAMNT_0009238309 /DNA_START=1140 /DNA_END=1418 /DNA_ORIENTATION=+